MKKIVVCCALLILAVPCLARGDNEFHALVSAIASQYGVHHVRIPLLGLATLCMRVGRVPGASGFKLAVFENFPNADVASNESFETSVQKIIGSGWHPLVRARSRDDGSVTMIYTNPDERELRLLIVSVDGTEATVVQTHLRKSQIWKWVSYPEDAVNRGDDSSAYFATATAAN